VTVPALDAALLGFAAAASPGPFQALLVDRAARAGARRALPLSLVPLCSDAPAVLACLFAVAGLPPLFVRGLGAAGGLLLCVLGWTGLRDLPPAVEDPAAPAPARPADRGFGRAVLVNTLNPNAWIFWSVVGAPLLAGALRASAGEAAAFLGAFYASITATNAALAVAFGAIGARGPRVRRTLAFVSAVAFTGMGLAQLWRAAATAV
jgi:threonine/homoserine/homoserine lactone efflux protein